MLKSFIADETGATAIEYGLIVALIAVAAIVSFMALGNGLLNLMGAGPGAAGNVIAAQAAKID
ncbi:Flp family type IVb pilin [Devosia sp.]|uniref:Flp family type IVb pilin n=1 Tax=Devosia sp. TaxID=1871048 RepID=UPI002FC6CBB2